MHIVMDSAGDVPSALLQQLDISVVPNPIVFGEEEFLAGVNLSHAEFYEKVAQVDDAHFPQTSQPSPYQFQEVYEKLIAAGDREIITIVVSAKLSGTYASAATAQEALSGQATFYLFDSQAGSAIQGMMAIEAARMAQREESAERILERLREMRDSFSVYFVINTLEYAMRSGRVGALRSIMASLLSIKPIMGVEGGLIVPAGRVRTYSRAISHIVGAVKSEVGDNLVKLAVVHAGAEEAGDALLQKAHAVFQVSEEILVNMTVAVAVHLGPGALGLVAIPETPSK